MTQRTAFHWHNGTTLYAGTHEVLRPRAEDTKQFQHIPAQPTSNALSALGRALINGSGFCVSEHPMPSETDTGSDQFLTLTGGSSGHPKVICRTQASWIASFTVNTDLFDLTSHDSIAVFGKLSHSLALYGVLEALHLGLNVHALDELRPKTQRDAITAQGITILYVTPTQLQLLTRNATNVTLSNVRLILCGGGMLDQSTQSNAKTLCPNAKFHVFYGAAETSFITLSDSQTPCGSVGRAYPSVTLRILDINGTPTDEIGEVWVKSPYLFECYSSGNDPDTQRQDGYVSVGEMGKIDAMGNLWLKGRKSRMVTIADQNVFPEDVEVFISTQSEFGANAVIPIADQTRGHRLVAVLEGVQDESTAQTVKEMCRTKFGALLTPHKVLFHPALPLLSSGKVDLVTLTQWVKDHHR